MTSALEPAGLQAARIAWLFWIFMIPSVVAYLAVLAALGIGLRRRRTAPDLAVDASGEKTRTRVVAFAIVVTVGVLVGLVATSFTTGRALGALAHEEALAIHVTAHQWWWYVEYPANPPSHLVTTANEIHVPVGRVVQIHLSSPDVIHSFWVPALHGKKDLIPGHSNSLWLRVDEPGVYRGQCAEFCGLQHAHMAFDVVAEPADAFEAWLKASRAPASEPADDLARHGREVFLSAPCASCHTIRGTDAAGRNGPDLTHLASRRRIAAGTLANAAGHLAGWILDPQSLKPGAAMPATSMDGRDLEALVAYLGELR
jgi:cytochrome c oxidase subunit 2